MATKKVIVSYEWDVLAQETESMNPALMGAWMRLRNKLALSSNQVRVSDKPAGYACLLRTSVDHAGSLMDELVSMGLLRKEDGGNGIVTLVYVREEERWKYKSSLSLRVSKYREDKNEKDKTLLPADFSLTDKLREFGERYAVCNIVAEFALFCERAKRDNLKYANWDGAWRTWVIQGTQRGWITTKQGSVNRPPTPPPRTDPIARGLWKQQYGDPKQYGYD